MIMLTAEAQARAATFIQAHARPLDRALYAADFENGTHEQAFAALGAFQNPDGGFGRALEPDVRLPDSSVIATTIALQLLREGDAPPDHPLVTGAIAYLRQTYDPNTGSWPIVPPHVGDAPHAPWWAYRADPCLDNPRPAIAGYFVQYAPDDLPDGLLEAVVSRLERLSDDAFRGRHDNLLSYLRLMETTGLPSGYRDRLLRKIRRMAASLVPRDPTRWKEYVLQPVQVVPTPRSPFADLFSGAVERNLDVLIAQQEEDGGWSPRRSWGDHFAEVWPVVRQEWKGHLTWAALKLLRAHGRLAAPENTSTA